MKRPSLIFPIAVIMLLSLPLRAQSTDRSFPLGTEWKFITGDSLVYAQPGYGDTGWKVIPVTRRWEESGYDEYDGFAWYRTTVVIPSSLKKGTRVDGEIFFDLGRIDDYDQTFLNGTVIGEDCANVAPGTVPTTTFMQTNAPWWNVERRYRLSIDDPRIRWDAPNVIAVRVFDHGGGGGIFTGGQRIKPAEWSDFLVIDHRREAYRFDTDSLRKSVWIGNTSLRHAITGSLTITVTDNITGKELERRSMPLRVEAGKEAEIRRAVARPANSTSVLYTVRVDADASPVTSAESLPYLLTPAVSEQPAINGASIYGQRPGKPFLYRIPASGIRPMTFTAAGLPAGLSLDPATGIITGSVATSGDYAVTVTAKNAKGSAQRIITFSIGDRIALTPPMGWNSWNCWGLDVTQERVLASAKAFVSAGLADHGWNFVNIDDGWEIPSSSDRPKRAADGSILVNEKFPDMKKLGNEIHALGLKFGIYSSPGPSTCGNYTASYGYERNDARSYASWGIDYLKYDWCSYGDIVKRPTLSELKAPYAKMRDELRSLDRDIVYSLCQYGMGNVWEWGNEVGGNLWRTTGDITDTWASLSEIGFSQTVNAPFSKPGNWNDPDMLIVGWLGWGNHLHPTRLTPDEQYTHISLWALLSSPMLIGCDLTRLDEFTSNLLMNDDVITIDQDPMGSQARKVYEADSVQVWVKQMQDGTTAVGLFNLSSKNTAHDLSFARIGLPGKISLRDVWRRKDLGTFQKQFHAVIPSHGVVLLRSR